MRVSVVIPTTLRAHLRDALASVRAQTWGDLEVIVVIDGENHPTTDVQWLIEGRADKVLWTGGGRGGSYARNLGVTHATGHLVAFLDDDDIWLPGKIEAQVQALQGSGPKRTVVASRVVQIPNVGDDETRAVPDALIRSNQRVEDYLFRNRKPTLGRAGIWTSSLLIPRDLAEACNWDETLPRHQDWDWLCRAQEQHSAEIIQVREPLVKIRVGSSGSISASTDWVASLQWAKRRSQSWAPGTYVDFLAGQTLRYATQARSWVGIVACHREFLRSQRLPSMRTLAMGWGGLLPRAAVMHALLRFTSRPRI